MPITTPLSLDDERAIPFSPLRPAQLYEQIAVNLEAIIRGGHLGEGERLPSERDLARQLEVSRSSVREAVAALATRGVIITRAGSGSFVADDARSRIEDDASQLGPTSADASPSFILQARLCLEPHVARLAAAVGSRDPEVETLIDLMEEACEPHSPQPSKQWGEADRRFHLQLAYLTENPVLVELCERIAVLMDEPLWHRLRDESVLDSKHLTVHLAEHRLIYEAITEGDGDSAEFYARRHLERVQRYMDL